MPPEQRRLRCRSRNWSPAREALSVSRVSHAIDRIQVRFDDENLVANAGLLLVGTLAVRLGLEALVNRLVRLPGAWAARGRAARCSPSCTPSLRGAPTSTTPTCCAAAGPRRCCPSG